MREPEQAATAGLRSRERAQNLVGETRQKRGVETNDDRHAARLSFPRRSASQTPRLRTTIAGRYSDSRARHRQLAQRLSHLLRCRFPDRRMRRVVRHIFGPVLLAPFVPGHRCGAVLELRSAVTDGRFLIFAIGDDRKNPSHRVPD